MVEIALSLAIIGFALVAILRVLPIGLTTQRDNREETVVNHDAALWMDALRAGPRGVSASEDLSNYVVSVTKTVVTFDISANPWQAIATSTRSYSRLLWPQIIGALSTPRYELPNATTMLSNSVTVDMRSMTGPAVSRAPQNNETINDEAFTYRIIAFVDDPSVAPVPPGDPLATQTSKHLADHLRDVRLNFRWPVLPNGATGNGRRSYRASFGGTMNLVPTPDITRYPDLWFFKTDTYAKKP